MVVVVEEEEEEMWVVVVRVVVALSLTLVVQRSRPSARNRLIYLSPNCIVGCLVVSLCSCPRNDDD